MSERANERANDGRTGGRLRTLLSLKFIHVSTHSEAASSGGVRTSGPALEILDGATGDILSRAHLSAEIVISAKPQLLRLRSGLSSIIFATEEKEKKRTKTDAKKGGKDASDAEKKKEGDDAGKKATADAAKDAASGGEKLRPGLTIISLQDLFKGDVTRARNIFEVKGERMSCHVMSSEQGTTLR